METMDEERISRVAENEEITLFQFALTNNLAVGDTVKLF